MLRTERVLLVPLLGVLAACGSSLFAYDPTGAAETPSCLSDAECIAGHCDPASHACFVCVTDAHCGDDAFVCRDHACVLGDGRCTADADCGPVAGKPRCDASAKSCVACLSDVDCGGGTCAGGTCTPLNGCTPAGPDAVTRLASGALQVLKAEATAKEYAACVAAGCCAARPTEAICVPATDDRPANCVNLADAVRFCRYVGGRVPSGAEWSALAGGEVGGRFPWGAAPSPSCSVTMMAGSDGLPCDGGAPAKACSRPSGNTPDGLCDVGGNLWEWTQEPAGDRRVLRGGSFGSANPEVLRAAFHDYAEDPSLRLADAGIRCVW